MYFLADKRVRSNKYLRTFVSCLNSLKYDLFQRVVNLVHHSTISMPLLPPTLSITNNKTKLIPCLLEAVGDSSGVSSIFYFYGLENKFYCKFNWHHAQELYTKPLIHYLLAVFLVMIF